MRALVYHGPGQKAWEEVPKPQIIDDGDAVVRVDAVTICGTDLHILKGDVPAVTDGRILGHEAVGTVETVGSGVRTVEPGDKVLVSCITSCGTCRFCREGRYGQCLGGGGWILGHKIDGTQAEYVRVPFADTSVHRLPARRRRRGRRRGPDRPVHDHGCAVVQPEPDRRGGPGRQPSRGGRGANATVEAVGVPDAFELAVALARPGGRIANIGVHGEPATLHLEEQWIRDVTITTGLVDTFSTPTLLRLLAGRQLDAGRFVTHRFGLDDFPKAYEVFADAAHTGALKVVLTR